MNQCEYREPRLASRSFSRDDERTFPFISRCWRAGALAAPMPAVAGGPGGEDTLGGRIVVTCPQCGRFRKFIVGEACWRCTDGLTASPGTRSKRRITEGSTRVTPPWLEERILRYRDRAALRMDLFGTGDPVLCASVLADGIMIGELERASFGDDGGTDHPILWRSGKVRERPPTRRRSWCQKVRIAGQVCYLTCGEDGEGRLIEVFLDAAKAGTFVRGALDSLARVISIALQCGTPLEEIVKGLRQLNFPPNGKVEGESPVDVCSSVSDWIARELEHAYLAPKETIPHQSGALLP